MKLCQHCGSTIPKESARTKFCSFRHYSAHYNKAYREKMKAAEPAQDRLSNKM